MYMHGKERSFYPLKDWTGREAIEYLVIPLCTLLLELKIPSSLGLRDYNRLHRYVVSLFVLHFEQQPHFRHYHPSYDTAGSQGKRTPWPSWRLLTLGASLRLVDGSMVTAHHRKPTKFHDEDQIDHS
ncbi:hypothetical protein HBH70_009560 [Parastagonospora nodorum]|nr:hypothetical protein HBH49_004750 [Parastagonospora nodorum]KAH4073291.1 hypothetical protein HBH50_052150 [Parastagonospora nodorum]KAH4099650.1 hypothetical protein HBH48_010000 [Parastagonospora nodorum]KAH4127964.1 hypothetical protein HBH47_040330 [Parastagonospora nodorum]KAH4179484.1 hypothetical protein HBH43_017990 [Parastagonospora nodorum]